MLLPLMNCVSGQGESKQFGKAPRGLAMSNKSGEKKETEHVWPKRIKNKNKTGGRNTP